GRPGGGVCFPLPGTAGGAGREELAMRATRRSLVGALGALGILGATGSGALLAACTQSSGGGGGDKPATGKTPVTMRWSPWDGEGQAIVDGANKGVDLYKQSHPNVSLGVIGQAGDINPKIDAMIAAGDGPDVFGGNGAGWLNRAKQGQFLGLDPFIKRDLKSGWKDDYVPA